MSVPPRPLSTMPLQVAFSWLASSAQLYASRGYRLRDAALPTCLTCVKIVGCDVSGKCCLYRFTLNSTNTGMHDKYTNLRAYPSLSMRKRERERYLTKDYCKIRINFTQAVWIMLWYVDRGHVFSVVCFETVEKRKWYHRTQCSPP
jgi:hypothetical protein